ncbi:CHAP domain-containing protein [Seonamhaeicola marinus]|nr:CHAP domain-containing protein [Seonamhaeicola marinus]
MKYRFLILLISVIVFNSCKKDEKITVHNSQNDKIKKQNPGYKVSKIGDTLDVFNGVYIFYNENMNNTSGRNLTKDGYNLGLKWQCVEFVKRYYFEHLNHKMPNSYGHAKDFFNVKLNDGRLNIDRNLLQYTNGSKQKPKVNDLIVFKGNLFNPYGHVAIVSKVSDLEIEIVQQNVGKTSRDLIDLEQKNDLWFIDDNAILGWLRKR